MRRTVLALLSALALSIGLSPVSRADILWFKNGRSMEGTVRDLPNGQVEITFPYGTLAFSRGQVDRVEKAISVAEVVDQALASLEPTDVERRFELAEWCREKREHTLAQRLYRQVLSLDPDHGGARQRLGYQRQDGVWMSEEEARLARGEVPFRGRWVAKEGRDLILAAERTRLRQGRLQDLEEARLALELSRLELESERVRRLPPANGLPLYPYYGAGPNLLFGTALGFPGSGVQPPDGASTSQPRPSETSSDAEEPRRRGTMPRHHRGGFVAPGNR